MNALRFSEAAQKWWGEESLNNFMSTVVSQIVERARPSDVAERLLALVDAKPPTQTAILVLHGVRPQGILDIAGVTIVRDAPEPLIERTLCAESVKGFAVRNLHVLSDLGREYRRACVSLCNVDADPDRAIAIARDRTALALCVLAIMKTSERWREFQVGWSVGTALDSMVVGPEGLSMPSPVSLRTEMLIIDSARLEQLRSEPGALALDELGRSLPLVTPSELQVRAIRSAGLVASSLTGELRSRFLLRWMAIESLFGERRAETTERLADRLAVMTAAPKARAERKIRFRDLYELRSDVAHGDDVRLEPADAQEIGEAVLRALTYVARSLRLEDSDKLFAEIDRIKFMAETVD